MERVLTEARQSALVSMTRDDMEACVKAVRMVHVDWIDD